VSQFDEIKMYESKFLVSSISLRDMTTNRSLVVRWKLEWRRLKDESHKRKSLPSCHSEQPF
jgi:hypothetical protein